MKYVFFAILVVVYSANASAQHHHLFADAGTLPGFSVTYNYTPVKHLGIGIGIQGYSFSPTLINSREFIPAVFADIHVNIRPQKNNQFLSFLDMGVNIYQRDDRYYSTSHNVFKLRSDNGFYMGLGFGYLRRITKRGSGPYAALKIISNWYNSDRYDPVTLQRVSTWMNVDGRLLFSLGFKF